jgi:glycosyltransferase involved in cell wall biosynthesis
VKIAVSMITLNEERYIRQALASCDFADTVAIVDGGSTDGTHDIIKEFGMPRVRGIVLPWENHFGNQRQRSLKFVDSDTDWIIRLDADEQFPPVFRQNIRTLLAGLPENIIACRIRQVNLVYDEHTYSAARGGWETWPRIWRNLRLPDGSPAWQWQGQVHEYTKLMTDKGLVECDESRIATLNVPVLHYGWLDRSRREEREALYSKMKGSGFAPGDLVNRSHVAKELADVYFPKGGLRTETPTVAEETG